MAPNIDDKISGEHFKQFAIDLEKEIKKYGGVRDFYEKQKAQVLGLVALEDEFRLAVIDHPLGQEIYAGFIEFICNTRRNILAARPYFRERQEVFTNEISQHLKSRNEEGLYPFRINFQFVQFTMRCKKWSNEPESSEILRIAADILLLRNEIVEMNMPLAISRARIFWSRTPRSQLSYMDLVQISSEGLMAAVDKFVPPFGRVFRAVIIGRITGNLIEDYSQPVVHFYPVDKRRLYRANKILGRGRNRTSGAIDYTLLADQVNEGLEVSQQTNAIEIASLLAAASCISADATPAQDPDAPEPIARFAAPDSARPDVQAEERQVMSVLAVALDKLTIWEQKIIRMRGVLF